MANTTRTYTGNGVTTLYPVDFTLGYVSKDYVYVYLVGSEYTDQLSYNWIDDTQIELTAPVEDGVEFIIRRVVPRGTLVNDYEDGAILREQNLDDSFRQGLMVQEEVADGFFTVGANATLMNGDLDMRGHQILSLPDPVDDNDPIRLKDLLAYDPSLSEGIQGLLSVTEELLHVDADTVLYTFPAAQPINGSAFYIRSVDGDTGTKLIQGFDYVLRPDIGAYTLELLRSWNTGSLLQRVYNSFSGATAFSSSSNKPVFSSVAEAQVALTFATGYEVVIPSLGNARYILRDNTYIALDGDITRSDGKVWELQPTSKSEWSVLWFGAAPDPTDTVVQDTFFEAAAQRVGDDGTVLVPTGRYKLATATTVATQWNLAPNSEIIGLGGVDPTFVTDTTNLTGSMIRHQRNAKTSVMFVGETDYATQKARTGETTGVRGTVAAITACSHVGNGGLFGGSVASKSNTANQACIGITGVVVNDNTTINRTAWASYLEAIQEVGAGGNTFTLEGAVVNKNPTVQTTPNTQPAYGAGVTAGLWISSGIGDLNDENASCWAATVPITASGNPSGFNKGWVVYDGGVPSGANYAEVASWPSNAATVWYPTKGATNHTTAMAWIKGVDSTNTGTGRIQVHVENVNATGSTNYNFESGQFSPDDNVSNLGTPTRRWKEMFAVNGTINTSDERQKEQIESLSATEKAVGLACKGLVKKFKWKDAVLEKGTDARIHVGVIAQEVQQAFTDAGLDADDYGLFTYDNDNGEDIFGIRYTELLCFIMGAID